jgi:hypothetical protein
MQFNQKKNIDMNQYLAIEVSDLYDVMGQRILTSKLSTIMPYKTVDMYWPWSANPIKFTKNKP